MKIQPLRPLLIPGVLIGIIALLAVHIPNFKPIDDAIISFFNTFPRGWESAMLLIAKIGDPTPLVLVALAVCAWELYRRNYVRSLVMAGSLLAMPTFFVVKETVRRARPVTEYVAEHGLRDFSFPSGHSTGTLAVYGMIAFLLYSHTKGYVRLATVSACIIIIGLVGFTRVYLGAHFPTDVLGGWLLGFVVISLLRSLSLFIAKRSDKPNEEAVQDTTEDPDKLERRN